jgi:flagellar basal body-associated protein FliL
MQIRDKDDKESKDYILQDNKKTRFGTIFIIIVLIILVTAVAMTGVYFDYW